MTGKEALTDLKVVSVCGYDSNEKEYYYSGLLNEVYDEEVKAIETDIDMFDQFKKLLINCTIERKLDDPEYEKLSVGEKFDIKMFRDLLDKLGYELHEKR